jgi:hypothetical protein
MLSGAVIPVCHSGNSVGQIKPHCPEENGLMKQANRTLG